MGGDIQDPELDQSRNEQGSLDDIGRSRGHAHAQDDSGHHGQNQSGDERISGEEEDEAGELQPDPGEVDHADDNAGTGAGRGHAQGVFGAFLEGLDDRPEAHAGFLAEEGKDDHRNRGVDAGVHGRIAGDHHINNDHQGDKHVSPGGHDLLEPGSSSRGIPLSPIFPASKWMDMKRAK